MENIATRDAAAMVYHGREDEDGDAVIRRNAGEGTVCSHRPCGSPTFSIEKIQVAGGM